MSEEDLKKRLQSPAFQFLKRQQQVAEWLEKIFNKHFDSNNFLERELKNGVYLCKLMIILDPRSIVKYHLKPTTPVREKENVFFFLEAAADYGVPKQKLFYEMDLIDKKNLLKVLDCLESLNDVAVKNGFAIPIEEIKDEELDFLDEQLAETYEMLGKIKVRFNETHHSIYSRQISYLISANGGDANSVDQSITAFQAYVRARKARKEFRKRMRMQSFRTSVAREILSTEEQYINNLKILTSHYKHPLQENARSKKPFIKEEEIKGIFSDIEIILGYNSQLFEDLTERIGKHWSASCLLGDIFLKILAFLKVYTTYVKQYDTSLEILSNLKKNSKFQDFLEKQHENPETHHLTLEMLLIMPIQRIPRYSLLLTELLKYTWQDHRDRKSLEEAQAKMKEVATYVNEKKREFENITKVRQIQDSFEKKDEIPNFVDPSRKFIRMDICAIWTGSNDTDKKHTEVVVMLFNDLVIVATQIPNKTMMKFKEAIKISRVIYKEPKMRKWTLKKNDMGKFWPKKEIKEPQTPPSPTLSHSSGLEEPRLRASSDAEDRFSRRFSLSGGLLKSASISHFYSVKNTVELVNSKEESILKVCFDSPLSSASWIADFRKAKDEIETINKFHEEKAMERALRKSEDTKSQLASSFAFKSMEDRKAEWRKSKTHSQGDETSSST